MFCFEKAKAYFKLCLLATYFVKMKDYQHYLYSNKAEVEIKRKCLIIGGEFELLRFSTLQYKYRTECRSQFDD